jgi:hypothetical protein
MARTLAVASKSRSASVRSTASTRAGRAPKKGAAVIDPGTLGDVASQSEARSLLATRMLPAEAILLAADLAEKHDLPGFDREKAREAVAFERAAQPELAAAERALAEARQLVLRITADLARKRAQPVQETYAVYAFLKGQQRLTPTPERSLDVAALAAFVVPPRPRRPKRKPEEEAKPAPPAT